MTLSPTHCTHSIDINLQHECTRCTLAALPYRKSCVSTGRTRPPLQIATYCEIGNKRVTSTTPAQNTSSAAPDSVVSSPPRILKCCIFAVAYRVSSGVCVCQGSNVPAAARHKHQYRVESAMCSKATITINCARVSMSDTESYEEGRTPARRSLETSLSRPSSGLREPRRRHFA